ncbi:DUF6531 domain-containing protein [Porticoccaceae bacterium]|nr:DUF6531 domain-containing protein [Porticoccaceae bacterium]
MKSITSKNGPQLHRYTYRPHNRILGKFIWLVLVCLSSIGYASSYQVTPMNTAYQFTVNDAASAESLCLEMAASFGYGESYWCNDHGYVWDGGWFSTPRGATGQDIEHSYLVSVYITDEKNGDGCGVGNPILPSDGRKIQREVDYQGGGTLPLSVSRHYSSVFIRDGRDDHWRFNIGGGYKLDVEQGPNRILVRFPDTTTGIFISDGNGSWSTDPDIRLELQEINQNTVQTGWKLTTENDRVYNYDLSGQLDLVQYRGYSHAYSYVGDDTIITDLFGKTLTVTRNDNGRVSSFTDPDGGQYSYSYNVNGEVTSVTYPDATPGDITDNPMRIYHYEKAGHPNALTGITDERGNRFATWTYDALGRADSSSHSDGADLVTIDYSNTTHYTDPRVIVTNPLGKQTTYRYTTIHNVKKVTQVEGHPSTNCAAANQAYTYDANGFLASKTDWKGNVTSFINNAKGQELSRTEAAGTSEARTITTEWHSTFNLPIKITEPEQETVIAYDANGNELSRVMTDTN